MKKGALATTAVFSRNWPEYLDAAAGKGTDERTTFRSNSRWVGAAKAIANHGPRRIYFASIDGGADVTHEADLVEIQLDPSLSSERTTGLLALTLPSTTHEGLWDNKVSTLYVIANCRRLSAAFPQTDLHKQSNDTPLDKNFIRSYALVHELRAAAA